MNSPEINLEKPMADRILFWTVLVLLGMGVAAVYSASATWAAQRGAEEFYLFRHLIRVILGVGLIFFLSKVDYHLYEKYSKTVMIIAVASLLILLITGGIGNLKGANRWLGIGPISFQPSELAKWALILHLSVLLVKKHEVINDIQKGLIPLFIWIGGTVLLIAVQPNFSTAAIIMLISIIMLFLAGLDLKYIFISAGALIPLAVIYIVSSPYRLKRLQLFLSGSESGSNYQLTQSIIALGNGGMFGVGIGQSKQRDFFLPEPFNDFIMPIIGEEYGFVGLVFLLGLFGLLLLRGVRTIRRAPDALGVYLSSGIVVAIIIYALINAGVTCGLLPTTGLPMPFISYGGTSILFTCAAIGVLLNISKQGKDDTETSEVKS